MKIFLNSQQTFVRKTFFVTTTHRCHRRFHVQSALGNDAC